MDITHGQYARPMCPQDHPGVRLNTIVREVQRKRKDPLPVCVPDLTSVVATFDDASITTIEFYVHSVSCASRQLTAMVSPDSD